MDAERHIRVHREGPIGVLTIDRRERFNALDVQTARDFREAGIQLARDRAVRVVVIRGSGGVFCSGADLKYIRDGGRDDDLSYLRPRDETGRYGPVFKQILEYIHSTISEIRRAPKPFVAAVDGPAAAGGFGIAMSCDLVLASERAWFEWAYFKTGLSGAESSTFMLPRLLGLRKAVEFVLLNPRLSAQEAFEWGLVNRVYGNSTFDRDVHEVLVRLSEAPSAAVATAKGLLNQSTGMERIDVHLDAELIELARVADGTEFAEGIEAFFSKRKPKFHEDPSDA